MSLNTAEQKIRKLARLPANCACPNCGTYKKFGFSTICIKYHTFVCNNCKSSHQAISHRCKSITMSSWSDAEAFELMKKGNEHARRTWLKNAPPVGSGGRPREGDDINVFKRFIETTYERKAYYGEDDGPSQSVRRSPARKAPMTQSPAPSASQVRPPNVSHQHPTTHAPAPVAATVPVADLLDFSAPTPAAAPSPQQAPASSAFGGSDPFAAFAAPAPAVAPSNNASGFSFMNNNSGAAAAPSVSTSQQPQQSAPSNAFADFNGMAMPAPTAQSNTVTADKPGTASGKKPVMQNMTMNSHSSAISMMNDFASKDQKNTKKIDIDPFAVPSQQGHSMRQAMPHAHQQQLNPMMQQNMMMQNVMSMMQQQQQQQQHNAMAQGMNFQQRNAAMSNFMQQQMPQQMNSGMGGSALMMGAMNSGQQNGFQFMHQQQQGGMSMTPSFNMDGVGGSGSTSNNKNGSAFGFM